MHRKDKLSDHKDAQSHSENQPAESVPTSTPTSITQLSSQVKQELNRNALYFFVRAYMRFAPHGEEFKAIYDTLIKSSLHMPGQPAGSRKVPVNKMMLFLFAENQNQLKLGVKFLSESQSSGYLDRKDSKANPGDTVLSQLKERYNFSDFQEILTASKATREPAINLPFILFRGWRPGEDLAQFNWQEYYEEIGLNKFAPDLVDVLEFKNALEIYPFGGAVTKIYPTDCSEEFWNYFNPRMTRCDIPSVGVFTQLPKANSVLEFEPGLRKKTAELLHESTNQIPHFKQYRQLTLEYEGELVKDIETRDTRIMAYLDSITHNGLCALFFDDILNIEKILHPEVDWSMDYSQPKTRP